MPQFGKAQLGATAITKAYLGSTLVLDATPPPAVTGPDILGRAGVKWYRASTLAAGATTWAEQNGGAATSISATGVRILPHTGTDYAFFPGTQVTDQPNYATAPGGGGMAGKDKLRIEFDFGPDGPGSAPGPSAFFTCPGGWYDTIRGAMLYQFFDGGLRGFGNDGNGNSLDTAGGGANSKRYAALTMEKGIGLTIETSDDRVTWAAYIAASVPAVDTFTGSAAQLSIAGVPYAPQVNPHTGRVAMWVYLDGVETHRFDPDADVADNADGLASFVSGTGETWTLTRATSGPQTALVTSPKLSFDGTGASAILPTGLTFGSIVAGQVLPFGRLNDRIWSAESASNVGVHLTAASATSAALKADNSAGSPARTVAIDETLIDTIGATVDGSSLTVASKRFPTPKTSTSTIGTTGRLTIGARTGTILNPARMGIGSFAVFPTALTATEMATVIDYMHTL